MMCLTRPFLALFLTTFLAVLGTGCSSSSKTNRKPSGRGAVAARIEARRADFRECFQDSSIPETIRDVRMMVRLWIDSEGTLTRSVVSQSAVKFPFLNECVLGVLQSIRFDPNPSEVTEIVYPLNISRD